MIKQIKVGQTVHGKDCNGVEWSGVVTEIVGEFSVRVDNIFTPLSLITSVSSKGKAK